MLKEQSTIINSLIGSIDSLVLVVAFILAYYTYPIVILGALEDIRDYIWILIFAVPVFLLLFQKNKLYSDIRFDPISRIIKKCFLSTILAFFIIAAILFFTKSSDYSRMLTVLFVGFSLFLITVEKILIRSVQIYLRSYGYKRQNVLVIGGGNKAVKLLDILTAPGHWGVDIVENLDISECEIEDIETVFKNKVVDEVYISFSRDTQQKVDFEKLLLFLEKYGKTVRFAVNLDEVVNCFKINFSQTGNIPTLVFHSKTLDPDQVLMKRVVDIISGIGGLVLTAFLFPFVALAIKLESSGPVLFRQKRVGMNGRIFTAYKFRSMGEDAEEKKPELMCMNKRCGPIFKIDDDPRITKIGKILRRTSIDELPQFWNILIGEMSLVGTRPPTCDEVDEYDGWHYRRVSIKPGLTGLWQVDGRDQICNFDDIVKVDLEYIDNWSFWLDFRIIAKTFWVVLKCTGR